MFTYDILDELELNTFKLLENGEYNFQVISAVSKISKNGNPMIKININVHDSDGSFYSDKNAVESYVESKINKQDNFIDDSLPFWI